MHTVINEVDISNFMQYYSSIDATVDRPYVFEIVLNKPKEDTPFMKNKDCFTYNSPVYRFSGNSHQAY